MGFVPLHAGSGALRRVPLRSSAPLPLSRMGPFGVGLAVTEPWVTAPNRSLSAVPTPLDFCSFALWLDLQPQRFDHRDLVFVQRDCFAYSYRVQRRLHCVHPIFGVASHALQLISLGLIETLDLD